MEGMSQTAYMWATIACVAVVYVTAKIEDRNPHLKGLFTRSLMTIGVIMSLVFFFGWTGVYVPW